MRAARATAGGAAVSSCDALTPAEYADLAIIASRARMDRGDMAPMRRKTLDEYGFPVWRVIPLMDAINLEVAR